MNSDVQFLSHEIEKHDLCEAIQMVEASPKGYMMEAVGDDDENHSELALQVREESFEEEVA